MTKTNNSNSLTAIEKVRWAMDNAFELAKMANEDCKAMGVSADSEVTVCSDEGERIIDAARATAEYNALRRVLAWLESDQA